ncbi:MAG TPA: inorganic phosphate transporter [Gammaproteobacteria bacterium]|nr:inorganic phosphate transporter [Gammaproteobacteria bacterium]
MLADPILIVAVISGFLMACSIGANDVANAMGTTVGSKTLTVKQAILLAAIFEALGAILAGGQVTTTLREGLIDTHAFMVDPDALVWGMLASLWSSGTWLILATYFGWPVSTTHTIVGAVLGFSFLALGVDGIHWHMAGVIAISWVVAPILSAGAAFLLFKMLQKSIYNGRDPRESLSRVLPVLVFFSHYFIVLMILNKGLKPLGLHILFWQQQVIACTIATIGAIVAYRLFIKLIQQYSSEDHHKIFKVIEKVFGILAIFSAAVLAFAHGSNDVANAIGPLATIVDVLRFGYVIPSNKLPLWVVLLGSSGVVVGLAVYGYRIMETVGKRITYLSPSRSFSAQLTAGMMVLSASALGYPVSTTQILVGSVVGVGFAGGIEALNLKVVRSIFLSWMITIPVGSILSMGYYKLFEKVWG